MVRQYFLFFFVVFCSKIWINQKNLICTMDLKWSALDSSYEMVMNGLMKHMANKIITVIFWFSFRQFNIHLNELRRLMKQPLRLSQVNWTITAFEHSYLLSVIIRNSWFCWVQSVNKHWQNSVLKNRAAFKEGLQKIEWSNLLYSAFAPIRI